MTKLASIPFAPGALPWIGHSLSLLRAPLDFMRSIPSDTALVRLRVGNIDAILACSPDLTRDILMRDQVFDKGGLLFDRVREFLGNGLSSCPYAMHRRHRRLVQPVFQTRRLPNYARTMMMHIEPTLRGWQDGQRLDLAAEMQALTARIVIATMFADLPMQTMSALIGDFGYVLDRAYRRMLLPPNLASWIGGSRYKATCQRLRDELGRMVRLYREAGIDRGDLLSLLVVATEARPGRDDPLLSDVEVTDHLLTFFVGGMETCGSVLTWAFYFLGQHPTIEARFHAELDAVLGDRLPKYEDIPALVETSCIVKEVLRIYPPAWIATRIATEDTLLGGHSIPAGSTIVISPYLLQHNPQLFPEPERFDPDRWQRSESGRRKDDPLFAWAGGARRCIGENFALTETMLTLASIGSYWRLVADPAARARPAVGAVLGPRGVDMKAKRRNRVPH